MISFCCLLIVACGTSGQKNKWDNYSPDRHKIHKAGRFSLDTMNGYTVLRIFNPWQGAKNVTQVYYLLKRGCDIPAGADSSAVIYVPVKSIVCMSTTHIAMISALGEEHSIKGVSGKEFIFSEAVIKNAAMGMVEDVGYEANLNKELILKISPDLIMMYGIGSESSGYLGNINEVGLKVLFNADYLEADPLGKAEWIKLFGALYCKENLADSIYESEVMSYNTIKSYVEKNITERPKVLLGLPFKDTWYISPGNSYMSSLVKDAGGDYLWQDSESTVSMPLGIENVYLRGMDAEFWLNTGSAEKREQISIIDERLADLPCFKAGNLFNNNKRVSPSGGNDYWECGSVYPHLVLKDIATILHPDLFSDHDLFFYQKLY